MLYLTPLYRLHYWLGAPRRVLTNITSYSSTLISLIIICLSICCLAREHFTTIGSGHRGKNREIISNFVGAWNGCFYNNMSVQEGRDIRNGDDHEIITETWIYCGNSFFTPVCRCSPVQPGDPVAVCVYRGEVKGNLAAPPAYPTLWSF